MAEVYKIQVAIGATNNISPVLAMIAKDFLKLDGMVGTIGKGMAGWAALLGADEIVKGLVKIAEHGGKLLDQQDQLRRNGIAQNDVLKLTADAYARIAKLTPTADAATILKTERELRAVTGSTVEAVRLTPKALMTDALLSNTFGTEMHGEYYKLLRAEEMKGISTDPAKREAFTDAAFSYITAFGGKLKAQDYQTLARRGGSAFINMKPEAMGPMSVLTADLGGDATGTAMMTFQQLMTGATTMSKQQGQMWNELGLINMDKVTKTGFGGSRLQLGLGALKGSQEHSGDLPGYIKDVLYPAIEKAAGGDKAKIEEIIGKMAPNRNANKMIHMFGQAGFADQIAKDMGLASQVQDIPTAYSNFIKGNPKGVELAYEEQKKSMLEAMGAPLMQAALPVMRGMTDMFTSIGQFANTNNGNITAVLGAISDIAHVIYRIDSAALSKLGDISGVSAVFGTLANLPWETLKHGLAAVNDGLTSIANTIDRLKGAFHVEAPKGTLKDGGDGLLHLQSFHPGERSALVAQPIALSLNVDGKTLAQAVSDQLMYLYEHSTRGYSPDGQGAYSGARGSFGT